MQFRKASSEQKRLAVLILAVLLAGSALILGARPMTTRIGALSYATSCSNALAFMNGLDANANALCHTLVNGLNGLTGNLTLASNALGITTSGAHTINLNTPAMGPVSYVINWSAPAGVTTFTAMNPEGRVVYGGPGNAGSVSGTDPAAVIQASVNALPNGGRIFISQGWYDLGTSTITLTQSINMDGASLAIGSQVNTCVCGTILNSEITSGNPVVKLNGQSITLRSIQINGNKASNSVISGNDCIQVTGLSSQSLIDHDSVVNCAGSGVHLMAGSSEVNVNYIDAKTNNQAGVFFDTAFDDHLTGGDLGSNVGPGLQFINAGVDTATGFNSFTNQDNGITISNSYGITLTDCRSNTNNKNGILIFRSISTYQYGTGNQIIGCKVYDNSQSPIGGNNGIKIQGSAANQVAYNNIITGNQIWDDQGSKTQAWAILETPTNFVNNNTITNNVVRPGSSGTINYVGLKTIVMGNVGFNPAAITTFTAMPGTFTYTNTLGYDVSWDLFTANGISAWTCDGITGYSTTPGTATCDLPPGGTMVITSTVTGPVFKGIPQEA